MKKVINILLILFAMTYITAQQCDETCKERIKIFFEGQMNQKINQIGGLLGTKIPGIGKIAEQALSQQIKKYYILTNFFGLAFGIQENIFPIDETKNIIEQLEILRKNFIHLYKMITNEEPVVFAKYSLSHLGTHNQKTAQLFFDNKTSFTWTINFLPNNTKKIIKTGITNLSTDQPFFQIYTSEKEPNKKTGTWFPLQRVFNNEYYTIKQKQIKNVTQNILSDNSTIKDYQAKVPVLLNNKNTV